MSRVAARSGVRRPRREKKPDLIPGAHLEPIVVEPEAAPLSAEEQARLEAEEEERARREAELAGEAEELDTASRAPAQMESGARFLATGKRKSAIARVTLSPGEGSSRSMGAPSRSSSPGRCTRRWLAKPPVASAMREMSTSASWSTAAESAARPAPSATASPAR